MNIKKNKKRNMLGNIIFTLIIISISILLQYILGNKLELKDENIFLVFTLAILIVIIKTKNIAYGIISSFIFVLAFNFFSADPIFTLVINDANYYISFIMFIVVSFIVGALVLEIQKKSSEIALSKLKVEAMYSLSSELIDFHDKEFIYNFVISFFNKYMDYDFSIMDIGYKVYGNEINDINSKSMLLYSLKKNLSVGKDTFDFRDSNYLVFPIKSTEYEYACLFVNLKDASITIDEEEFIKKNILHLVVALDREEALLKQESQKLAIEKEKFKINILRSLSHDLKTPLTSIKSGSDLILTSYDQIDDDAKKEIITDIYDEACDLQTFIVNLLNMSKLDKGSKLVNLKNEPVDDILSEVYRKTYKNLNGKSLNIHQLEELVFVYTDPVLLDMVFVNLIDNAIKHTKANSKIDVSYKATTKEVTFFVEDDGGGIDESSLDKIFDDFYSLALNQDHRRSTGLGLSICRAIVEAHGGKIKAYNNSLGGTTFEFNIPSMEANNNGK